MISTYYINTYYIDAYCIIALRFIVQYAVKVFNENEKLPACGDFSIIQLSNYRPAEIFLLFNCQTTGIKQNLPFGAVRFLDYFSGLFYNIVYMRGSIRMRLQQKKEENDYDKKHDRFRQM